MNNKYISMLARIAFFNVILVVLGLFSYTHILGSQGIHLSLSNIFGPMIGLYAGLPCAIALYTCRFLFKGLFLGSEFLLSPLSFRLPTLFAAAYWAKESFVFRFIVPLSCIILFNLHPVGQQAFYYSLYWLIPLALYFAPQKNIVVQALASSFVAHAVGSVLWLYFTPMTPEMFVALMPIVIVERLVMAGGMVMIDTLVSGVKGLYARSSVRIVA